MKDVNGKELFDGAIVEVSGSYAKRRNGIFVILETPETCVQINNYKLKRVKKIRGGFEISTSKQNVLSSWPLVSKTNDDNEDEYNEKYAQIKIIGEMPYYRERNELLRLERDIAGVTANIERLDDYISRWHKTSDKDRREHLIRFRDKLTKRMEELEAIVS